MDWWAADAFCQALGRKLGKSGMHLVSLEGDLGCPKSTSSYCPDDSYGKALADKLKLLGKFGGWTSTLYSSKCAAYAVLNLGKVSGLDLEYGGYFALCE